MVLNDLLTRQNVFTKILIKDGDKELPKELKVKVMRIRMAYTKMKKNFDAEVQEFIDELMSPEFKELNGKAERTSEENTRLSELTEKMNSEYQVYIEQKGKEEIEEINDALTEDEYADIVEVNAGNVVEINGMKIPVTDFLEVVHDLFVK
jgi:predicted house-cleaning noncanonical NTP pyrophosphatase (MazG superfamily)